MTTALAVPDTADELTAVLTDRTKLKAFIDDENGKAFPEFMTKYMAVFAKKNYDVDENLNSQIERQVANYLRDHKMDLRSDRGNRPATAADIRAQRQSATQFADKAPGAKINGKFTDLTEFLNMIDHRADPRDPAVAEARKSITNAMSSTDPASGGFLIPEEFRATLMQVALEEAVVRSRATVIPMGSLRTAIPIVDSTSNATSVWGGVIGFWTEEGAALTQSQPNFGRVVLEAKKLTAYTEVPNELRRDSAISVETLIGTMFPRAIAWFEDIAFMFGSGVGEPLGIFTPGAGGNGAIVTQAAETGQLGVASGTPQILWENIVKMYSRMLPSSLGSAVWVVSPAALPELMTTALSVGTGGALVGMSAGQYGVTGAQAPVLSLLGRPVIISEKVGTLGAAGDVNFVDFAQYLVGDRMQMEAEISTDYRFGNDLTAYRFIERVDGRPWLQSAITPRNGGPTLSPYVQLAARP